MSEVDDAPDILIRTFPAFEILWRAQAAADPELGTSPYTAVGQLATHIVDELPAHPTATPERTFEAVEELTIAGDAKCRNLVIVGFLEDLQNVSPNSEVPLVSGSDG